MSKIHGGLDDQLGVLLLAVVGNLNRLVEKSGATTQEMVNLSLSLKSISESILALNKTGVSRLDQESVTVLLDKIKAGDY